MRILSVEVEQYRGITGPLSLKFEAGLNVLYGPNEIGKSTLLAAIWDGLTLTARGETERHRSIQPHGDGRPRVKVTFVRGGVSYVVEKTFAGKSASKSALRITSPTDGVVELAGTEAEERLRGVLGVGETARSGELKPEDQGVWPLVRVLQGESGRSPNEDVKTESARASLGERLATLSGAVLGGEGAEELIQKVRTEYLRHYTETGQPAKRGDTPVWRASQALDKFKAERDRLRDQLKDHDAAVDRHARLEQDLDRLRREQPRLDERHRAAQAEVQRIQKLKDGLGELDARRGQVEAEAQLLTNTRRQRDALLQESAEAEAAAPALAERHAQAQEDVLGAEARLPPRRAEVEARRLALDRAGRLCRRLRAHRETLDAAEAQRRDQERLRRALAAKEKVVGWEAEQRALRPDDAGLGRLEQLQHEALKHTSRLEGAAATLVLTALRPFTLHEPAGERSLAAGESATVHAVSPQTLTVDDRVALELRPGGADLHKLREAAHDAEHNLRAALQAEGHKSLDEARDAAQRRREIEARLNEARAQLREIAPKGLPALEEELAQRDAAARRAQQARDACSEPGDPPLPEHSELGARLAEAEQHEQGARVQSDEVRDALVREEANLKGLITAAAQSAKVSAEASARVDRLRAQLTAHRAEHGVDGALSAKLERALSARQHAAAEHTNLVKTLAALHPEQAERDAASAARSLEINRNSVKDAEQQKAEIAGTLSASGAIGLHDRHAEQQAKVDAAEAELAEARQDAEAAKLLYETLRECRDAAQERLLAPLQAEVASLLRLIFPDATAKFDERYALKQISRDQGADSFDELSFGAREQLGLVMRLAFARLLGGEDGLPVLLDDALVATDEARLERTRRVLDAAAASGLQLLLVTCHWPRLREAGLAPSALIDLEAERRRQERRAS